MGFHCWMTTLGILFKHMFCHQAVKTGISLVTRKVKRRLTSHVSQALVVGLKAYGRDMSTLSLHYLMGMAQVMCGRL